MAISFHPMNDRSGEVTPRFNDAASEGYRQALAERIRRTNDAPSIAKMERVDLVTERLIQRGLAKLERLGAQQQSAMVRQEMDKTSPAPAPSPPGLGQTRSNAHPQTPAGYQAELLRAKHNAVLINTEAGSRLLERADRFKQGQYQKIVLAYEQARQPPSRHQPEAMRMASRDQRSPSEGRRAFTERSQNNTREQFRNHARGARSTTKDRGLGD